MIEAFVRSESGAVTVDWVVITAAVVGIGLGAASSVRTGTASVAGDIDTSLSAASVGGGVLLLDGFAYSEHTANQWNGMFAAFANRSDDDLMRFANGQSNQFLNALNSGDLATAQLVGEYPNQPLNPCL